MAKTLNPDQIAMLDKEVQKLDKSLNDKDKEKAMGMLMKKVGIKESDLDELSLSMKNITKSGISKNVGVDKEKLKMGLKDLRKKLDKDKKKDENVIVRSKKGIASLRRKSYQDNPHTNKGDEKEEGAYKRIATSQSSKPDRMAPGKGLDTYKKKPKTNEDRESNPIDTSKKSGNFLSTKDGAGMTKKGVAAFRAKNPGSKLKTAVTGKVKRGSKDAKRRKSFCARSKGWTGERGKAARRRWKC